MSQPTDPLPNYNEATSCSLIGADSIWVGLASVLITIMAPAVGFIYAGLVHQGAMGSMLGLCFAIFGIVNIIWVTIGYSLVFGDSIGGFIGNMRYAGMKNLDNYESKCIGQFGEEDC